MKKLGYSMTKCLREGSSEEFRRKPLGVRSFSTLLALERRGLAEVRLGLYSGDDRYRLTPAGVEEAAKLS